MCLIYAIFQEAKPGSGYGGRSSPHTDKEFFEGLTVSEAAEVCNMSKAIGDVKLVNF